MGGGGGWAQSPSPSRTNTDVRVIETLCIFLNLFYLSFALAFRRGGEGGRPAGGAPRKLGPRTEGTDDGVIHSVAERTSRR